VALLQRGEFIHTAARTQARPLRPDRIPGAPQLHPECVCKDSFSPRTLKAPCCSFIYKWLVFLQSIE
jgi:hypothetical protein